MHRFSKRKSKEGKKEMQLGMVVHTPLIPTQRAETDRPLGIQGSLMDTVRASVRTVKWDPALKKRRRGERNASCFPLSDL